MRTTAWVLPALFAMLALIGPIAGGDPKPPALAASAAQLLPPGTRVQETHLASGGLIRALEVVVRPDGLHVRGPRGWRVLAELETDGRVHDRRMWLGTDQHGSSLLARTALGARTSLIAGLVATFVALVLGTTAGLAAAFASRGPAGLLRLATDGLLALPRLLLLLILAVALRPIPLGIALAIGLVSWMELQRLVEIEGRALRQAPFVDAARSTGIGGWRLAVRHVLPNLARVVSVAMALIATEAILLESALGYLGIGGGGVSWGRIVADGQRLLPDGWWIAVFPGLLLTVTALALHHLGAPARRSP